MPVVAVYGVDPLLTVLGSTGFGNNESEFDYFGGFSGAPVQLVKGKITGLPIPARAEFVVEGYVYPDEEKGCQKDLLENLQAIMENRRQFHHIWK